MSIYLFLLVVLSLTCGSLPASDVAAWRSVTTSIGLVLGWTILCHVTAGAMAGQVRRERIPWSTGMRWLQLQLDILRWLGLPVTLICLGLFRLAPMVVAAPVLEHSLMLQSVVLLMPGIIVLMATWSAEHCFGIKLGLTEKGIDGWSRSMLRAFRAGPAWLLGPTLVFMALGDVLSFAVTWGWFELPTLDAVGLREPILWIAGILVGLVVVWFLPRAITWLIKTEPIHPEQLRQLEQWLHAVGISTHPVWGTAPIRWNTSHRSLNAMIAGLIPWGRRLLISDRILDELPTNQLMMVIMHEVAHAKRFHVPLRMLSMLPAWFASAFLSEWLVRNGWMPESWGPIIGGVGGLFVTIGLLGLIAYATEIDADATACRLAVKAMQQSFDATSSSQDETSFLRLARASMRDALIRVTAGHPASRRASWLHPSLEMRLRWLGQNTNTNSFQFNTASAASIRARGAETP
ncbi:MAG: M48 family metalloprotease [Planctomycetota bacterium]